MGSETAVMLLAFMLTNLPYQTHASDYRRRMAGMQYVSKEFITARQALLPQKSTNLNCADFNFYCRWHNEQGPNNIDWQVAFKPFADSEIRTLTRSKDVPDGTFLLAKSNVRMENGESAMLVSDVIPCQNKQGYLTLRYWASRRVYIQVCTRRPGSGKYYMYCSGPFKWGRRSVAETIVPNPGTEPFEIIIEATNFVASAGKHRGGIAMIDDIQYNACFCNSASRPVKKSKIRYSTVPLFYAKPLYTRPPPQMPVTATAMYRVHYLTRPIQASPSNAVRKTATIMTPWPASASTVAQSGGLRSIVSACTAIKCNFGTVSSNCSHYFRKDFNTDSQKVGNRHTGIRLSYSGPFGYVTGPGNVTILETRPFSLREFSRLSFCYYNAAAEGHLTVDLFSSERKITIYQSPEVNPSEPHKWNCIATSVSPGSYNTLQVNAKKLRNALSYMGIDEINLTDMSGSEVC